MPVLNIRLSAQGKDASGKPVPVTPQQALGQRGPIVQVTVSVGDAVAKQLASNGVSLPNPIPGLALIDTGASTTCIDEQAAQALGVQPIDVVSMASASHANTQRNVYPIHIEVQPTGLNIEVQRAIGAELAAQGLLLLVGRDVLSVCLLVYNGWDGSFTLSL